MISSIKQSKKDDRLPAVFFFCPVTVIFAGFLTSNILPFIYNRYPSPPGGIFDIVGDRESPHKPL